MTAHRRRLGVAIITAADEAVAAHQRVAEAAWRDALKGAAAAARVRELIWLPRRLTQAALQGQPRLHDVLLVGRALHGEAQAADEGQHRRVVGQHMAR